MPITNGAGGTTGTFNIGRDLTLVLVGPNGNVELNNVMSFESKQETASIRVDRLDGVQMLADLPKGWSGSFEIERGDPNVDNLFASIEQAWFAGGSYQVSLLYTYIIEGDQTQTVWEYDNVALSLADAGSWKGDSSVKQRVNFQANRRRSV